MNLRKLKRIIKRSRCNHIDHILIGGEVKCPKCGAKNPSGTPLPEGCGSCLGTGKKGEGMRKQIERLQKEQSHGD